jgi:hypothetical protein
MPTLPLRLPTGLLFLAALLPIAPAHAWDSSCSHGAERRASLDSTGATRVVVIARAGDLEVRPAQGTVVQGTGKACASSEDYLRDLQLVARRDGDVINLEVTTPGDLKGIGLLYAYIDLAVEVPAGLPVEIQDSSGDIEAHDVQVVKVQDSSGDLELHGLTGDVAIMDSSGDVRVTKAAGRVQVHDSSGDIVIEGAREVVIPSDSSGDITIDHVAGDVRIDRDSSGDIRIADVGRNVQLLSDTSGEVKISRVQGTVRLP